MGVIEITSKCDLHDLEKPISELASSRRRRGIIEIVVTEYSHHNIAAAIGPLLL